MSELMFVIKTAVLTIAVIFCMQIKVGPMTLEQRSLNWMRQSYATNALRGVADGAVAVGSQGYEWARKFISKHTSGSSTENSKARRSHWASEAAGSSQKSDDADVD